MKTHKEVELFKSGRRIGKQVSVLEHKRYLQLKQSKSIEELDHIEFVDCPNCEYGIIRDYLYGVKNAPCNVCLGSGLLPFGNKPKRKSKRKKSNVTK